jgi:hypothetical protein
MPVTGHNGSCLGRYLTGRQPGALQYTARYPPDRTSRAAAVRRSPAPGLAGTTALRATSD